MSKRPSFYRSLSGLASVSVLMAAGVLVCTDGWAQVATPRVPAVKALSQIPSTAILKTTTLPKNLISSTGIDTPVYSVNKDINQNVNTLTIKQNAQTSINHWGSFDISADATVNIQQSPSMVMLNRVDSGANLGKTTIEGMLNAGGQVYIYNPNGIVFGKTANINVNSLIATSLNIKDDRFLAGLLAPSIDPVFAADATLTGPAGDILVDGDKTQQATLTAANGGKIMLFAPNVTNKGQLYAPDGQVVLAAGSKIFLAAPDTSNNGLRGLLVEVNKDNLPTGSSVATNGDAGQIFVDRGNATMVGYAVNQMGTVSASTSVNLDGSIYLRARVREGLQRDDTTTEVMSVPGSTVKEAVAALPTLGGTLKLGQNSVTQISIVDDGTTASHGPTDPVFNQSRVDLSGQSIQLQENAKIVAPYGNVTIAAKLDPHEPAVAINPNSFVDLAAGSVIDVSGTTATKSMESNVIQVQLLSELADNVPMRDSSLRGQTVSIDIRKGTKIANVSSDLAKIQYTVGEIASQGGTVTVASEGSIIQRGADGDKPASLIDVHGGQINYRSGYVNTTRLSANGALFDIATASPNRQYDSFVNLPNGSSNYEAGYTEGMNAGTVQLSAPAIVMQGNLNGSTVSGKYQRQMIGTAGQTLGGPASQPVGGKLIIGAGDTVDIGGIPPGNKLDAGYQGNIVFGGTATNSVAVPAADSFDTTNLLYHELDVDTARLNAEGISRVTARTAGDITVAAPISLAAGGTINFGAAGNVEFQSGVSMPGGTLIAKAHNSLKVDSGVAFDLAGKWTNDSSNGNSPKDAAGNLIGNIPLNGGALDLSGGQVVIGDNFSADVSGGAWLNISHKLANGAAGSISIKAQEYSDMYSLFGNAISPGVYLQMGNNVSLSAYSLSGGGKLTLQGRNVTLGGSAPLSPQRDLWLSEDFFTKGGFTNYDIGALGNFVVSPGSTISPQSSNWQFNNPSTYQSMASGSMHHVAKPVLLDLAGPVGTRSPTSITFRTVEPNLPEANTGNLTFGDASAAKTILRTDPGASVTLIAGQQLGVDGSIETPAGNITVESSVPTNNDVYSSTRGIWFGDNAKLSAKGSDALLYATGNGISAGQMRDGGSIRIGGLDSSGAFTTATGFIAAESGASFDVSGAVSTVPVSFKSGNTITTPQQIASSGGSIDLRASEGLLFAGTLSGKAGNANANGGSLSITLDQGGLKQPSLLTSNQRILTLSNDDQRNIVSDDVKSTHSILGVEGQGTLSTKSFADGGFDRLSFKSQDVLAFSLANGPLALNAKSSLILDAPNFSASNVGIANTVQLNSAYIQMGSADYLDQVPQSSSAGSAPANLNLTATTIDLIGNSALQNFDSANLTASEDIRLVGLTKVDLSQVQINKPDDPSALDATGSLNVTGKLVLNASQIYPTTLSTFTLNVQGATAKEGQLDFNYAVAPAAMAQTPLSAGGKLIGNADIINQNGKIVAPFGSIELQASDKLSYGASSVTSVAGAGLIPFGQVQNGRDWIYDFGNGNAVSFTLDPGTSGNLIESALPQKTIVSKAPNINIDSNATLDLSGGGDLYAYAFTPGSHGSVDVLNNTGKNNTPLSSSAVFAINPNFNASVAPVDPQYNQGGLQPGESVYLSGIAGLPAGTYTLLPAHYALLPGGYSISLAPNSLNMSSGSNHVNLDGSMTIAGRITVQGKGDAQTSGWIVSSNAVVRKKSEYQDYTASSYFRNLATSAGVAAPMLPNDGGHVSFDASQSLALNGKVLLGATAGGRNGTADISAPDIVVVSDGNSAQVAGKLVIGADQLNAMHADSLLLGGLRKLQSDGTYDVAVGAQNVTIQNDKDHVLSGPEIILAAQDSVQVDSGAVITAQGTLSQAPQNLTIQPTDTNGNNVGTDGALLRLSSGAAVSVLRNAPSGNTGTLNINSGAIISAAGSAYLDGTQDTINNGNLVLSSGAALGVGASRISLGSDIPQSVNGLQFDTAGLAALSNLSALQLNSYSSIDLYGTVNLGSATMKDLSFRSSGFQGYGTAADTNRRQVSFTADTVRFDGQGNSALMPTSSAATAGSLIVKAQDIQFGNGAFAINGYANAVLNANREARAVGTGTLTAQNDMTVAAGRIAADGLADATIQAGRALILTSTANPVAVVDAAPLGGRLHFKGDTIVSDASIQTPAGQIDMAAVNGVHIAGGTLNAGGGSVAFGSTTAYAPGGSITLDGGTGNVLVDTPATLDVSAVGAAGGTLAIKATNGADGIAVIDGTLKGGGYGRDMDGALPAQGTFTMDVDKLATNVQFDSLNAKLNNGGFTESRNFRVRQDDVVLTRHNTIKAHNVVVATDNGSITIGGKIDASGDKGGGIELYASQAQASGTAGNVTLTGTAELFANANVAGTASAGSTGDGGRVVIGTGSADGLMPTTIGDGSTISLNGALINVLGNGQGQNGSVTLRAPRVGSSDVAITNLNATIVGSPQTVIEGYKTYTTSKISASSDSSQNADGSYNNLQVANSSGQPAGLMYQQAQAFANNANSIMNRLGTVDVSVQAGIDVRSLGDLTVSVNETSASAANRGWNLNAWRFNNGLGTTSPGTLTLRAAGDLNINGSISDGFVKPTASTTNSKIAMPDWSLDNKASWSYRLTGGADISAANPLAVNASNTTGNVNIQFARTSGTATDNPVAMVRTGTGRIDVAAGHDVVLGSITPNNDPNQKIGATIYTAGVGTQLPANMPAPQDALNTQYEGATTKTNTSAAFSNNGGAISIYAGNDVVGVPVAQLINNWLFRQGRSFVTLDPNTGQVSIPALNTAWWTRFDYFNQGIATFGGGDINVVADKGSVKDLSVSIATNAYMTGTTFGSSANVIEQGGGDLRVRAGSDILGGTFYVQKGNASITAGDSIKAGSRQINDENSNPVPLRTVLALGDANINVSAGHGLEIET
ncbi:MAG: two-partner secretion domain-containing protein, partial [Burkholderiaceae bacterium]